MLQGELGASLGDLGALSVMCVHLTFSTLAVTMAAAVLVLLFILS
jgi:hypothetical protein